MTTRHNPLPSLAKRFFVLGSIQRLEYGGLPTLHPVENTIPAKPANTSITLAEAFVSFSSFSAATIMLLK